MKSPEHPIESNEEPIERREFLKRAGKFLGGAAIAASGSKQIFDAIHPALDKKEYLRNREREFNLNLLVEELVYLRSMYRGEVAQEIERRLTRGVAEMIKAIKAHKVDRGMEQAGRLGIIVGSAGPLGNALNKIIETKTPLPEKELEQQSNKILFGAMVGRALSQLGAEMFHDSKHDARIQKDATLMAEMFLPQTEENLRFLEQNKSDPNSQVQLHIAMNAGKNDEYFQKELKLMSQLERWAAASTLAVYHQAQQNNAA